VLAVTLATDFLEVLESLIVETRWLLGFNPGKESISVRVCLLLEVLAVLLVFVVEVLSHVGLISTQLLKFLFRERLSVTVDEVLRDLRQSVRLAQEKRLGNGTGDTPITRVGRPQSRICMR